VSRTGKAAPGAHGHAFDLLRSDPIWLLREIAPTHLLHLAWHVPAGGFWKAPENLDWVAASLRLLRAFASAGGARAVIAGSCAEYDWSSELLHETDTALRPHSLYGEAKASLFRLSTAAAPQLALSLAWGRIFFPYGPREKGGRLFSGVIDGIASGEPVPCSEGSQIRDFMHVVDCGRAFAALLKSSVEGAVNIASGDGHAVREFIQEIAKQAGRPDLPQFGARRLQPGEPPVMLASVARLRHEVGFAPRYGFSSGIARAVAERLILKGS
jgi:nucleoside-diphosphate-sugar epimerase